MPTDIFRFIPRARVHQIDRVAVAASPAQAWSVVRATDLYELRFVRALFTARLLPQRVGARLRRRHLETAPQTARLDEIVAPGSGFQRLAETPGEEFVAGAIGRFWEPTIPFALVSPETFATFAEPGFGKVAWSLQVHPRSGGGSWVVVEVGVTATDDEAWRKFVSYWRMVGPFSRLIRKALLRSIAKKLVRARPERERELPGDELLPSARVSSTHAITIESPVRQVWPWLVQMGCRRGGWYSIDRLDNGGVPSADRILPEFQFIAVGDVLPATPNGNDGFAVLRLEPEHVLVLGSPSLLSRVSAVPTPGQWGMLGANYDATWAFVLEPIGAEATRLTVRVRSGFEPTVRIALARPAILSVHAIMETAQLRNLKRRAEALVDGHA